MSVHLTDRLSEDLAAIVKDAEEIFHGEDDGMAARAKEMRDRLADALAATDKAIRGMNGKSSNPMETINELIRDKPYHAVGLAIGIGLLIGLLLKRK